MGGRILGGLYLGGLAFGGLAFGGLAFGGLYLGGLYFGGLCFGGLGLAFGGIAAMFYSFPKGEYLPQDTTSPSCGLGENYYKMLWLYQKQKNVSIK